MSWQPPPNNGYPASNRPPQQGYAPQVNQQQRGPPPQYGAQPLPGGATYRPPQQQQPQQNFYGQPQQQPSMYAQPQKPMQQPYGQPQYQQPPQQQYQQQPPQQQYQQHPPQQQYQQPPPNQQQQQPYYPPQQQHQQQYPPQQQQYQQRPPQQQQYQQPPQQGYPPQQQQGYPPQQQGYPPQQQQYQQPPQQQYQQPPQQQYQQPPQQSYGQQPRQQQSAMGSTVSAMGDLSINNGRHNAHPMSDGRGTIAGVPNYSRENAQEDAVTLRKAMKGMGSTKPPIIEIACTRSNSQKQMIRHAFITVDQVISNKKSNRDLMRDLESELTGNLEKLIMQLFMTPAEFDIYYLKKAMDGVGCDADLLMEILLTRSNSQLNDVKRLWDEQRNSPNANLLFDRVRGETGRVFGQGNFQMLLIKTLECNRSEDPNVDDNQTRLDAEELNRSLGQSGSSASKQKFIEILTTRSWQQIAAIGVIFQDVSKKFTMDAAVKKQFGKNSDTAKGLALIVRYATQPYDVYAEMLRKSMKGMGTDDTLLVRTLVGRAEIDLENVKAVFGQRWGDGQTLQAWIQGDCSGNYRNACLKLAGY